MWQLTDKGKVSALLQNAPQKGHTPNALKLTSNNQNRGNSTMSIRKVLLLLAIGGMVSFYLRVITERHSKRTESKMTKDEATMEILRQLNDTN